MDNSAITIHGPDTSPEGMRHGEFYNCTGIFDGTLAHEDWVAPMNYWITWRGGSGIVTDNTLDDIVSWAWGQKGGINLECQMINRNAGPYACWNNGYPVPHQTGQGYPAPEGVYIWNNNAKLRFGTAHYGQDECGHGYVVTNYIRLGRDYFGSAKSGYAKYTYPHPARNGSQRPPPPTASATPSSPQRIWKNNGKKVKKSKWRKAKENSTTGVAEGQKELGQ